MQGYAIHPPIAEPLYMGKPCLLSYDIHRLEGSRETKHPKRRPALWALAFHLQPLQEVGSMKRLTAIGAAQRGVFILDREFTNQARKRGTP